MCSIYPLENTPDGVLATIHAAAALIVTTRDIADALGRTMARRSSSFRFTRSDFVHKQKCGCVPISRTVRDDDQPNMHTEELSRVHIAANSTLSVEPSGIGSQSIAGRSPTQTQAPHRCPSLRTQHQTGFADKGTMDASSFISAFDSDEQRLRGREVGKCVVNRCHGVSVLRDGWVD